MLASLTNKIQYDKSGNLNIYKHFNLLQLKTKHDMSLVVRKPVFGVSDQDRHKPGCTATEDGLRLEISYLGRRGIVLSVHRKNKGADQLRGYCEADLCFCFRICKKLVFSQRGSYHGQSRYRTLRLSPKFF